MTLILCFLVGAAIGLAIRKARGKPLFGRPDKERASTIGKWFWYGKH